MSEEQLLANQNDYLEAGVHIATKVKSPGMKKFIYRVREDGLYLLDLKTIDSRIKVAASMIARYKPQETVVTASRIYAIVAAQKFAEIINAKFIKGRVTPGVFTNPNRKDFMEPRLIIISDSRNEKQAVKEASKANMPIIALSDTDNSTKFIDLIIPSNNRGRRSLAFIYYLMAREALKARGDIKSNEEFKYGIDDFEAKMEVRPMRSEPEQERRRDRDRDRDRDR
jgi:small subunit ribosomal protein S2